MHGNLTEVDRSSRRRNGKFTEVDGRPNRRKLTDDPADIQNLDENGLMDL